MLSSSDSDYLLNDSSSDDKWLVPATRRQRVFKKRMDYFNILDDIDFKCQFRLSKGCAEDLLQQFGHHLQPHTARNVSLSPSTQLIVAMRFYSLEAILLAAGDFVGVSKASACSVVWKVSQAICKLRRKYIIMDSSGTIKEKFYNIARFPCIVGAIDCTHIRIQSPGGENPEVFRNRKGYFSLNVQCVCDASLLIRDICCMMMLHT